MEQEKEQSQNFSTTTETVQEIKKEQSVEDFPRWEDVRKSEKEVKYNTKLEGVTEAENDDNFFERPIEKKKDAKTRLYKRRLKILTGVYLTILSLLGVFAITNLVTLIKMDKQISSNTETIRSKSYVLTEIEKTATEPTEPSQIVELHLNEPRDYKDDKKELTFLDKLTIIFRNIFS